jgi:hypothetical protein
MAHTGREIIFNEMVIKVSDRMFEVFRFEQGDPDTESKKYKFCASNDNFDYAPTRYTPETITELIDGFSAKCGQDASQPQYKAWQYYDGATDEAIRRLVIDIIKEAKHVAEGKIHAYDARKIAEQYRAEKAQKEELSKMESCELCGDATPNLFDFDGKRICAICVDVQSTVVPITKRNDEPAPAKNIWKRATKITQMGDEVDTWSKEIMPGIVVSIEPDSDLVYFNIKVSDNTGSQYYQGLKGRPKDGIAAMYVADNITPEWLTENNFTVSMSPVDFAKMRND